MHALFSHLVLSIKPFKNKILEKENPDSQCNLALICKVNRTAFKAITGLVLVLQWSNQNEPCTTNTHRRRLVGSTASRLPLHPLQLLHLGKAERSIPSTADAFHTPVQLCHPVHKAQRALTPFSPSHPTAEVGETKNPAHFTCFSFHPCKVII